MKVHNEIPAPAPAPAPAEAVVERLHLQPGQALKADDGLQTVAGPEE